ncbi:MAG: SDH family Clp fold serine proteinase [Pirellulaceae bacterium]
MHVNPNELIKDQLVSRAAELERVNDADVLTFIGAMIFGVDDAIRDAVEELSTKRNKVLMVLETPGGYMEIAHRIADTLRHHYGQVEFLVPSHAMSAGTILVMSGDAIWMNYYSILGPIDPQIEVDGKLVPALGYLEKYNELVEKANTPEGLNDAELAYLLRRFDPAALYQYEHEKLLSVALLKDWLVKYKFKDWVVTNGRQLSVTPEMKEERAREIAEELNNTERWHSHGRGISMAVAINDLNLMIDDFDANQELKVAVRHYYKLLKNFMDVLDVKNIVHTREKFSSLS